VDARLVVFVCGDDVEAFWFTSVVVFSVVDVVQSVVFDEGCKVGSVQLPQKKKMADHSVPLRAVCEVF